MGRGRVVNASHNATTPARETVPAFFVHEGAINARQREKLKEKGGSDEWH